MKPLPPEFPPNRIVSPPWWVVALEASLLFTLPVLLLIAVFRVLA